MLSIWMYDRLSARLALAAPIPDLDHIVGHEAADFDRAVARMGGNGAPLPVRLLGPKAISLLFGGMTLGHLLREYEPT